MMQKRDVYVIVGSTSDLKALAASKLEEIFGNLGITFQVHVISAHRNNKELHTFCANLPDGVSRLFIAVAGWAAVLAGALAAETSGVNPIIGVPLPGGPYSPTDSLFAMASMPPGRPVMVMPNLDNAALAAAQILAFDPDAGADLRDRLLAYQKETTKPPLMNVNLADYRKKE